MASGRCAEIDDTPIPENVVSEYTPHSCATARDVHKLLGFYEHLNGRNKKPYSLFPGASNGWVLRVIEELKSAGLIAGTNGDIAITDTGFDVLYPEEHTLGESDDLQVYSSEPVSQTDISVTMPENPQVISPGDTSPTLSDKPVLDIDGGMQDSLPAITSQPTEPVLGIPKNQQNIPPADSLLLDYDFNILGLLESSRDTANAANCGKNIEKRKRLGITPKYVHDGGNPKNILRLELPTEDGSRKVFISGGKLTPLGADFYKYCCRDHFGSLDREKENEYQSNGVFGADGNLTNTGADILSVLLLKAK